MGLFTNLYEAKRNRILQVASIPNIGLLQNLGLRNGTKITVQNRYSLGGPVLLRVEDAYSIAIGKDIATQIAVQEVYA
jgi:Fe2+ transport system protein FeoA